MPNEYDFEERLAFSRGTCERTHPETIRALIGDSCVSVTEPSKELNLLGIDFVAELRGGARLNIDVKSRDVGCKNYWNGEPDLALETYSMLPASRRIALNLHSDYGPHNGKPGWTLDESKLTDYTLHVFDPTDTVEVYLLPFQLLRMAFRAKYHEWIPPKYRKAIQGTPKDEPRWWSECVFVPASIVTDAICEQMRRKQPEKPKPAQSVLFPNYAR